MESSEQFPFASKYEWSSRVLLGQGAFGKVFKVLSKEDGNYYAIKQMAMEEFNEDPDLMKSLEGEIAITTICNSPHTVNMIASKIGKNFTYIVLQICDTDLRKELASRKYTEKQCVAAFEHIIKGMKVLVDKGYIHRDIKPANVLIKQKTHYKLADFGFACLADIKGRKKLNDVCGTPLYMAPQLLNNEQYTAKSDVWSLGLMLYEMIYGFPPWSCRSFDEYLYGIEHEPLNFPFDTQIGEHTKDFIKKSLVVSEDKRMSWQQVFEHPLVKQKVAGKQTEAIKIDPYVTMVFTTVRKAGKQNKVNWKTLQQKYKSERIDSKVFAEIMKQVDSSVTSNERKLIFQQLDDRKQGWISWQDFKTKFLEVDYRSQQDVLDRKLDELVAIFRDLQVDPKELFQKIDLNKNGQLDFMEFKRYVAQVAPKYTKQQLLFFFKKINVEKNGLISQDEFLNMLMKRLPGNGKIHEQRAQRNLNNLIGYVKYKNISPQSLLKEADKNKNNYANLSEFQELIKRMKFNISQDETQQVFNKIAHDKQKGINLQEFIDMLA